MTLPRLLACLCCVLWIALTLGAAAARGAELGDPKKANEHLSRLSFVDALTGLANRRCFDETLDKEWRRAGRLHMPIALVIADVDGFKLYNDAFGHPAGDSCLAAVADVFLQSVGRAGDLAARYGGEEFVVLIPASDHAAALAVAEGLRQACEALAIALRSRSRWSKPTSPGPVGSALHICLAKSSVVSCSASTVG